MSWQKTMRGDIWACSVNPGRIIIYMHTIHTPYMVRQSFKSQGSSTWKGGPGDGEIDGGPETCPGQVCWAGEDKQEALLPNSLGQEGDHQTERGGLLLLCEIHVSISELEIRICKCTDIMSIHYQFCTDVFKFYSDIFRFYRCCPYI